MRLRALIAFAAASLALAAASASSAAVNTAPQVALTLNGIPAAYATAVQTHNSAEAARLRTLARIAAENAPPAAATPLHHLVRSLDATRVRLQPWPLDVAVKRDVTAAGQALGAAPPALPKSHADQYSMISAALERTATQARAGNIPAAELALATAYTAYAVGPALRLASRDPQLAVAAQNGFFGPHGVDALLRSGASADQVRAATERLAGQIDLTEQTLGDVPVSHGTIVADAAVIVFREGLEAVLILAAITASLTGARARHRREVLIGAGAGFLATALTWLAAEGIVSSLPIGGMKLQALTGVLAIGVMLVVTNWFFHKIYWSEWISRFNRRRKHLERFERTGFISAQALGFVILGVTSIYREGFETVLFLQSLEASAGTATTMIGVGIGLGLTLLVGLATFLFQRKLPYKRMLILTGFMIAFVLAIMVGTTAHAAQGLGWLPSTATPFTPPLWANTWLGLYPTWETIALQVCSLVFVLGSYVVARELQVGRRRRALDRDPGLELAGSELV